MVTWVRRQHGAVLRRRLWLARPGASVAVAAVACTVLAGCAGAGGPATTGGGGASSRHQYDSMAEVVDASDLIVSATAGGQRVVVESPGSAMTFTLTDLAVDDVVLVDDGTAAGSMVTVRQITTAEGWTSSEPDAPLVPGEHYLLFLVRSGLPGEHAGQLHPVGVVAGIYRADGDAFTRLLPDGGGTLPLTVTADELCR